MRNREAITLAVVLIAGCAMGAGGMYVLGPYREKVFSWFYYSETDGRLNMGIKPDGTLVLGEKYDREAEVGKLLQLLNAGRWGLVPPACHETGYEAPARGVRRVYPGTAFALPPIVEQGL